MFFKKKQPFLAYICAMIKTNWYKHFLFWGSFYAIAVFNNLYLSESFSTHPTWQLFGQTVAAQGVLLATKILLAYYLMYQLLDEWQKGNHTLTALKAIGALLVATLVQRILMYVLIWTVIYRESTPQLTVLQQVARYFYSLMEILPVVGVALLIKIFSQKIADINAQKQAVEQELNAEIAYLKTQLNYHFFYVDKKQVKVHFDDILYIESLKDYIRIHLPNKKITTKMQIGTVHQLFDNQNFIRIHKSYIINVEKINAFNSTAIEIANQSLPIGRTYKESVMKALEQP